MKDLVTASKSLLREPGMLIHIIADYGHGDLAFAEVVQRLKLHLPEAEPFLTPVPAFSTLIVFLSKISFDYAQDKLRP